MGVSSINKKSLLKIYKKFRLKVMQQIFIKAFIKAHVSKKVSQPFTRSTPTQNIQRISEKQQIIYMRSIEFRLTNPEFSLYM